MKRPGPGWIPNQHGAWAMLASPLLVGVLAGGPAWAHLPLTAFWFAGYFAFFATSQWLKAHRKARWFPPVRAYGVLAGVLGVTVVLVDSDLLRWAPLFIAPLTVGLVAAAQRHERALLAGLATTAGSALMTVVAYDAGTGSDPERAWILAATQFVYFAGTVLYVKTVIRERENHAYRWLSAGYHVAALLGVTALYFSWPVTAVFVLLLIRSVVVPPLNPSPKTAGIGEIAATFAVVAVSLAG